MNLELKNSENYISSKVGKNNPFTTPKDYLSNLENNLLLTISEHHFPKKKGFELPDNYFKGLEDSILEKVITKKQNKVISLKKSLLKAVPFAAAASILLFIALNSFIFNTNSEQTIDNLSDTDIEYWINNIEINDNDVAIILEEDILVENDFSLTTLKSENIEDYINSIDNSSLLNEIN